MLTSRHGLDLDVARDAVRDRPARNSRERRQRFAGKGRGMPGAGIELGELCPGKRVGAAAAVGRAVECVVVQQERHAVAGELDIELDHSVAVRLADAHRRERVLRRELPGAAMRRVAWIRPGVYRLRAWSPSPAAHALGLFVRITHLESLTRRPPAALRLARPTRTSLRVGPRRALTR